jgi:cobalt/nickel transport system ATP-binding protein
MQTIVDISNLSYTYPDGTVALKDVSLKIYPREKVGITGANGAGKSTLILHLNGLLLSDGRVRVAGIPLSRKTVKEIRSKIGMVFQNPDDQLFCPTLYDDIAFGPRNLGWDEAEIKQSALASLAKVGLKSDLKKGSFHLSYGEKRRASLAAVLAMRPEILVLDEPTCGLDPKGAKEVIELLASFDQTQIIVSHDLHNLAKMVDRVVLMSEGRIIADDKTELILNDKKLLTQAELI